MPLPFPAPDESVKVGRIRFLARVRVECNLLSHSPRPRLSDEFLNLVGGRTAGIRLEHGHPCPAALREPDPPARACATSRPIAAPTLRFAANTALRSSLVTRTSVIKSTISLAAQT